MGIEHVLAGLDAQEAWNRAGRRGLNIAAADAKIAKQQDESGKHTSGGVMVAVKQHLACSAAQNGGCVGAGDDNQGRIDMAWLTRQER